MATGNDNNVYVKRGNKYVPFGVRFDERYLPDGIWYVHHDEHSSKCTNVDHYLSGLFKVGDDPKGFIDIPKLCKMDTYVDYVLKSQEFRDMLKQGYYSYIGLVSKVVALVVNLNETIKDKSNDDNKRFEGDFSSF